MQTPSSRSSRSLSSSPPPKRAHLEAQSNEHDGTQAWKIATDGNQLTSTASVSGENSGQNSEHSHPEGSPINQRLIKKAKKSNHLSVQALNLRTEPIEGIDYTIHEVKDKSKSLCSYCDEGTGRRKGGKDRFRSGRSDNIKDHFLLHTDWKYMCTVPLCKHISEDRTAASTHNREFHADELKNNYFKKYGAFLLHHSSLEDSEEKYQSAEGIQPPFSTHFEELLPKAQNQKELAGIATALTNAFFADNTMSKDDFTRLISKFADKKSDLTTPYEEAVSTPGRSCADEDEEEA